MSLTQYERDQRKILIDKLLQMPLGKVFREIKANEIFGYNDIIKRPMDLETVKRHLINKKEYSSHRFKEEMRLIFDNCRQFNKDIPAYVNAANELQKIYEKKYEKLAPTPREKWLKDISNVASKLKSATKQLSREIKEHTNN